AVLEGNALQLLVVEVIWAGRVWAHCTLTEADARPEPASVLVKLPVLLYVPHEEPVVGLVMCNCLLCPAARLPIEQVTVPSESEQLGSDGETTDQLTPVPVGGVSVTVTPFAATEPLFVTVTTKPICPPALTLAASAVFVMATLAAEHAWLVIEIVSTLQPVADTELSLPMRQRRTTLFPAAAAGKSTVVVAKPPELPLQA